ncbi:MAG: adenylate kinase [Candidatus Woesearchaeota archaeon]|nr:adenylate kinase [Candidatus Woesearchaeota archaeon]MDK2908279.1 adenylate kinase [Candidatus Woesearchaeota archaeon]
MNIVILGSPASGKGTQASKLSKELEIPNISIGNIFRENIELNTQLGKLVKPYITKGKLVPDEITTRVVIEKLSELNINSGFILDGFPRNLAQAKAFQQYYNIDKAILIEIDDETVMRRISGRRICPNCGAIYNIYYEPPKYENRCDICGHPLIRRKDDNEQTAMKRLKDYKENTLPVIEFYDEKGILIRVNGLNSPDEIFDEITKSLTRVR